MIARPVSRVGEVAFGGLVVHGLLSLRGKNVDKRRIFRRSLQGGVALATSSVAYNQLAQGRSLNALGAVAVGAAAVWLLEDLIKDSNIEKEEKNGQKLLSK